MAVSCMPEFKKQIDNIAPSPARRQSHAIRDPMANGVSGFAADRAVCSVSLALEFASVPARALGCLS